MTTMNETTIVKVNGAKGRLLGVSREHDLHLASTFCGSTMMVLPTTPPIVHIAIDQPMAVGKPAEIVIGKERYEACRWVRDEWLVTAHGKESREVSFQLNESVRQRRERERLLKKQAREELARVRKVIASERATVKRMVKLGHAPKLLANGTLDKQGVLVGYNRFMNAIRGTGCSVCGEPLADDMPKCTGHDAGKESRERHDEDEDEDGQYDYRED